MLLALWKELLPGVQQFDTGNGSKQQQKKKCWKSRVAIIKEVKRHGIEVEFITQKFKLFLRQTVRNQAMTGCASEAERMWEGAASSYYSASETVRQIKADCRIHGPFIVHAINK